MNRMFLRNGFLGALLLAMPFTTAFAQRLAEPGTFDVNTEKAHQGTEASSATTPVQSLDQVLEAQPAIVKTQGRIIIPESSVERAEDLGVRVHTNYQVFAPSGMPLAAGANLASPNDVRSAVAAAATYTYAENPGSIACVYGLISFAGCTPAGGFSHHATGGSGAIVVVDAFHNPDAASDLAYFSSYWGLPAANFTQVYCQAYPGTCYTTNTPPATNTGWALEEALDIEYAHAMAPSAKIILVEANSSSLTDLTWAEAWAGYYAEYTGGGGQVTNSWGGGEFSGETSYDYFFNNYSGNYKPVVYFASGGDSGTISYPSASPYVISAGGTTINRDASGNYVSQTCWTGTGRGVSAYETIPSWQGTLGAVAGSKRSTTDLSAEADPASGVWVYEALNGGWFIVGGTSVASPVLAGVVNNAGSLEPTTFNEASLLYSEYSSSRTFAFEFYDPAPARYDTCTGIGTPFANQIGK